MKQFVRDNAWLFAAAAAFSLVANLALLAPSLYMLQVFDRVLATRSIETLVLLSLITAGALLLVFALELVRARLLALSGLLFERRSGAEALRRVLDAAGRGAPAQQHAHAMRDIGALRAFLSGAGIVALFDAPWMLVYIGVIFLFDALLGWLALASAALLVLLAWINERATRSGVERAQAQSREVGAFVDAALRSADVVRALGMAPAIGARWQAASLDVQQRQLGTQRIAAPIAAATRALRQAVQVAMLGLAAWLVVEQRATPGVMIAVTIILGRALAPAEALIAQWKSLVEVRASARRLQALLDEALPQRFAALPAPSGRVALDDVAYVVAGRPIVRGVKLDITAGEVVAIVGPSGSGKSTVARLLTGIVPASAGSVRIDGADIAQWEPARLGTHVGYLPQEVALLAGSIADNIARFGDAQSSTVVEAARRAHAHDAIVRLPDGYQTQVGDAGRLLSGGQRQRVALARALHGAPRIVVLDEPNACLDSDGEAALVAAIAGLRADGVSVVLITQRTPILSSADRIVVMRDGTIERIGVRQDRSGNAAVLPPAGVAA